VEAALRARVDVVLAHLNAPAATLERALAAARDAGARTVLNASPLGTLAEPLVRLADVLVLSAAEAAALAGAPVADAAGAAQAAAGLLTRGCGAVVVTLGARGVLLATPVEQRALPAPAVQPVDTTGAGDAFVAGLGVALARDAALVDAARYGIAAAALAVQARGTWAAMPRREDVERLPADEEARTAGAR
jgi:ribokinase